MADSNPVGRPAIHTDPKEVERLCMDYFNTLADGKPPTVTGLTLHLGFCDKSTLYDYAKKPEFTHPIKKAITFIEQFHEEATAYGEKCVGNIFILKNFGWKDTIATEHSGGIDFNLKDMVKFDNPKS
jgi:hypothetical protein